MYGKKQTESRANLDAFTPKKVLIVEDEVIERRILTNILMETYQVFEAGNGREGLDFLEKNAESIDIILLDVVMPVMDGYEFMTHLKRDPKLRNIPVLVMTGERTHCTELKALSLGADDFLQKPYEPAFILPRMSNLIRVREAKRRYDRQVEYLRATAADSILYLEFDLYTDQRMNPASHRSALPDVDHIQTLSGLYDYMMKKLIPPEDRFLFSALSDQERMTLEIQSGKSDMHLESRYLRDDNNICWARIVIKYIVNPVNEHPHIFITVFDITEQKQEEVQYKEQAQRDPLTKLLNRSTFEQLASQAIANAVEQQSACAFFMVDLDDFKLVNDTYGHAYGDEVLQVMGQRLKAVYRADDIIGRLGGDEFAVLIRSVPTPEVAYKKGIELCRAMGERKDDRAKKPITCSVGITILTPGCTQFENMYNEADQALYQAKQQGKGQCVLFDARKMIPRLEEWLRQESVHLDVPEFETPEISMNSVSQSGSHTTMIRKDREMNKNFAYYVFDRAPYMTLSMVNTDGTPYCIPVSAVRIRDSLYIYTTCLGKKNDVLTRNDRVSVTAVSKMHPVQGKFSIEYESAIATGRAFFIRDEAEKKTALRSLCRKYAPNIMDKFETTVPRNLQRVCVLRIDMEKVTGKRKKYDKNGIEMKWGRME